MPGSSAHVAPLLPRRLAPGDLVAVAAPSGAVRHPQRLSRGVAALRRLGFTVSTGPMTDHQARRDPRDRAAELTTFLRDPQVRAVVAAIGGHTSNGVLDLVDWSALRADPKPIIGYSDITALLLAGLTVGNVVTFHGPTVLPEFAEYPRPLDYTRAGFLRVTGQPVPAGRVVPPPEWTEEFLAWGSDDVRPRRMAPAEGWQWSGAAPATGPLIGGNLETLCALGGTRYWPDWTGAVVLLETVTTEPEPVERCLAQLAMLGVFDGMVGLVAGRTLRGGAGVEQHWRELIRRWVPSRDVPMLFGADVGHTDPMATLPIGVRVRLDPVAEVLEIVDAAVC
ncbi:LD-carboxypeptidase [Solwaraspora sp. WMMD406]|uniref:S66 peptidase family protein n=1 Tax=Solwaraspora sp. WMMD406 TaxID=3016095 RepID=UPI0024170D70|nr:S66 peptidase family protein [Solwaraspora sp. WMMD406]MDG4765261.1 LD-carboxypeptidase [Solwaraspora sp. WMMD406]